jgi:type IV secretory pathway TraG/TraD family ATPase VirD4
MNLESIFVRMLNRLSNRRSKNSDRTVPGFSLGQEETLIGHVRKTCTIPFKPIQHTFISGRTGSGKTTLLQRIMAEHLLAGTPFLFIDFHGHATESLLAFIGSRKTAREVVLFDPWSDPVVGWNPLVANGRSAYPSVQELVGIFHRRLWPDAWGPRLEELLRMTLLALAEAKLTLLEATDFISKPTFRRAVLAKISLHEVREFWTLRFERLSPSQRSLVSETVLNKLSVFQDPAVKHVVGQSESTFDFCNALQSGQTIIANLSGNGLPGNNFLLAALLVAKLKSAVYHRPPDAGQYAIFLDEFQEMLALDALDDYLRSFRKFNCSVFLATQQLHLAPELKAAIFGNCARFFCFATSATDAAFLGREFGGLETEMVTALLPDLPVGHAIAKFRGQPVSLLRVKSLSMKATPQLVERGRSRCLTLGRTHSEVEQELKERMARFSRADSVARVPAQGAANAPVDEAGLPEGYGEL